MKKLLFVLVLAWVGGGAGLWYWNEARPQAVSFRTAHVKLGDLLATINATGTLEPEEVVDVGSQVAGALQSFGSDPSDSTRPVGHGTAVKEGTVLARLDDALFKARVDQAGANVAKAEADVEQAEVKLKLASRELDRAQRLLKKNQVSAQEFDQAVADSDTAKASLAVAQGSLALAKANLEEASVNLGYATIKSPVDGVVVDRRVNLGQTVVSTAGSPSLFLIARDLSRMEIWASVNETDVGQIRPGQKVRFTVSAHPSETFRGTVAQIRLNASMNQSVVTYTVVVAVENQSGKLLPYLTARLQFELDGRKDVLLVPNSALRWTPAVSQVLPVVRDEFAASLRRKATESAGKAGAAGATRGYDAPGTLWVKDGEFVRPVEVRVGLTDGASSEVTGEGLKDGTPVVIGLDAAGDSDGASPFLPKIKNDKAKK